MSDLVMWLTYGFGTFYFTGDFIGLKGQNLKMFALLGLTLGGVRELTGKSLVNLLFKST